MAAASTAPYFRDSAVELSSSDSKMRDDQWLSESDEEDMEELFAFSSPETVCSCSTLASQVNFLQQQLQMRNEELSTKSGKISELEATVKSLQALNKTKDVEELRRQMLGLQEQLDDRDRQLEAEKMRSRVLKETLKNLTVDASAHEKILLDLEAEKMKCEALKQSLNELVAKERALEQTALDLEVLSWELESVKVRNKLLEGEVAVLRRDSVAQPGVGDIVPLDCDKLEFSSGQFQLATKKDKISVPSRSVSERAVKRGPGEVQRVEVLERTLAEVLSCLDDERARAGVGRIKVWCLKNCLSDALASHTACAV